MVKLYCDRCGKEIEGKYYTIFMDMHSIKGEDNSITFDSTNVKSDLLCVDHMYDAFRTLYHNKFYCEHCKDLTLAYLNNEHKGDNTLLDKAVNGVIAREYLRVTEFDRFVIDYDKLNDQYRVRYYDENNNIVDACMFDAYRPGSSGIIRVSKCKE